MKKFLEKTAEYLRDNYEQELQDVCVILPNRRGGLFLKKYLAAAMGKTCWAPAVYSVEDFFAKISGLKLLSASEQLFELFEVHKNIEKEKEIKFDEFLTWAPQMLHDFTEIDSYLVDPGQLFSYLSEAKAISLWNPDGSALTDFEKQYLRFYNSIGDYYKQYRERLLSRGTAYPGLMFRETAARTEEIVLPWTKVIIAGMNALTGAEEKVYDYLFHQKKAEFLWDADVYYLSANQEAGYYLKKWKAKWGGKDFSWEEDHFAEEGKKIQVTGLPDDVGQVKYCGELLCEKLKSGVSAEEIAVVLPDEQLLIPLLNSLPPEAEELNVTMGLPLHYTPLYSLYDSVFQMHLNVKRLQKADDKRYRFYYRDMISVLKHPYMVRVVPAEKSIRFLKKGNKIFYTKEELTGASTDLHGTVPELFEALFSPWNSINDAVNCLRMTSAHLAESFTKGKNKEGYSARADLEYLFSFSQILKELDDLVTRYNAFSETEIFYRLFAQMAGATKLPFYGEPLRGIQVMGMLETRSLDFKEVIVLSMNEGVLPSAKSNTSFIPYEIKRTFGLPTYHHNNAVYGYHFYRLIQSSEKVHLLYNMTGDKLGGGEKSRFLNQLLHEIPQRHPNIDIHSVILSTPPPEWDDPRQLEIAKDKDVLEKLTARGKKGLAPSALNLYRSCPMKFYFSEIAGIKIPEEIEETVDSGTLGSAVHAVLRDVFSSLTGQQLAAEAIGKASNDLDVMLTGAFREIAPGCDMRNGKNLLIFNIARILIGKILRYEAARLKEEPAITVTFLEKWLPRTVRIKTGKDHLEVLLKGQADRIDRYGNGWMVLDYKTGSFNPKELKIEDWDAIKSNPDLDKAFQVMMYAWLLQPVVMDTQSPVCSGVLSVKNLQNGISLVSAPGTNDIWLDHGVLEKFGSILNEIVTEIYDEKVPFRQCEDDSVCSGCNYITLCCR